MSMCIYVFCCCSCFLFYVCMGVCVCVCVCVCVFVCVCAHVCVLTIHCMNVLVTLFNLTALIYKATVQGASGWPPGLCHPHWALPCIMSRADCRVVRLP